MTPPCKECRYYRPELGMKRGECIQGMKGNEVSACPKIVNADSSCRDFAYGPPHRTRGEG